VGWAKSREFVGDVADPTLPEDDVNELVQHREDPNIGGVGAVEQYHGQRTLVDRHAYLSRDIHLGIRVGRTIRRAGLGEITTGLSAI
jgi:hypothetical protein